MPKLDHWIFLALLIAWIALTASGRFLGGAVNLLPLAALLLLVRRLERVRSRPGNQTGVQERPLAKKQTAAR